MSNPPPVSAPAPELPLSFSAFDGLDWDAPPVAVRMLVELPFRLMCEDASYDVTVDGCTIAMDVLGQLIETDADKPIVSIHQGTGDVANPSWVIIQNSDVPAGVRAMRTTFAFTAQATPGAIRGLSKPSKESINAHRYARALLDGHIEHINNLINCYRVAAGDPFPFEVTAWDLNGVYIQLEHQWHANIHLIPYLDHNQNPVLLTREGAKPILYAAPEDVRKILAAPLPAGEVDLQDGWAHFVRGRFADAITSFVTAIEVALEAAIERALTVQGLSESERKARLATTFNNFDARFSDYLRIAKRAAPGPIVSLFPHIHGLRLREEFGTTRSLRHKVVHEGMRLSSTLRGPALRVAETTTWLFDWISQNQVKRMQRRNHPTKLGLAGQFLVKAERTPAGIRVLDPRDRNPPVEVLGVDTAIFNRLASAIEGPEQDIQLFFQSALSLLKIGAGRRPADASRPASLTHAYDMAAATDKPALALLADIDGLLDLPTLDAATGAILEESREKGYRVRGLLVVNHQRHLALDARETVDAVSDETVAAAGRRGFSILTTADLYELLLISRGKPSRYEAVRKIIQELAPGRIGLLHPAYHPVGLVQHYYAKANAISVQLNSGESLTVGQTLALRLTGGFPEFACTELQVEHTAVQQTPAGVRVGIRFESRRNEVRLGEVLYLVQDATIAAAPKPDEPAPPEQPPPG